MHRAARSRTCSHAPTRAAAALIDPVLGFELGAARTHTAAAERIAAVIRAEKLELDWVLETHIHADHLSAAQFFKQRSAPAWVSAAAFATCSGCTDRCSGTHATSPPTARSSIACGRTRSASPSAGIEIQVLSTPGHTLDGVTYRAGRHAFVGDTVVRADFGTARADLVGGDAATLFHSISRLVRVAGADRPPPVPRLSARRYTTNRADDRRQDAGRKRAPVAEHERGGIHRATADRATRGCRYRNC